MRRHSLFLLAAFLLAVMSGLGGCDKTAPGANLGLAPARRRKFPSRQQTRV